VHSWYKRLPIKGGGEFVFFIAPDAGTHTKGIRRLDVGWDDTDQYRRRFGHLDYLWRIARSGPFARDGGGRLTGLPAELLDEGAVVLYPYACSRGGPLDPWDDPADVLETLDENHPGIDALRRFARANRLERESVRVWSADEYRETTRRLMRERRASGASLDEFLATNVGLTEAERGYLVGSMERQAAREELHQAELVKIRVQIEWLRSWVRGLSHPRNLPR